MSKRRQNKILVRQPEGTTPAIRCGFGDKSIAIWQDVWVEILSENKNGVKARITPVNKKEVEYMISGPNIDCKTKSLDVEFTRFDLMAMQLGW